jgi:hypothetical protein
VHIKKMKGLNPVPRRNLARVIGYFPYIEKSRPVALEGSSPTNTAQYPHIKNGVSSSPNQNPSAQAISAMARIFNKVNTVEYISNFSKLDTMNSFRSCLRIANQLDLISRPCKSSGGGVGPEIPAEIDIAGSPKNWFNRG